MNAMVTVGHGGLEKIVYKKGDFPWIANGVTPSRGTDQTVS